MTDTNNTHASPSKRSVSPDEGEVVDDPKRQRRNSPSTRYNGDARRHRVVYEGEQYGRGRGGYESRGGYNRGGGYRGRGGYDESRGYRDRERRYEHPPRSPLSVDHRDKRYSSQYERRRSPSERHSRNRSTSSERRSLPFSRDRTPSRNNRSPSPQAKKVQFSSEIKSPTYNPVCQPILMESKEEPAPDLTIIDEEALIEERRRKREAILAKYQGQSTPSIIDNLKIQSADATPTPGSPVTRLGSSSPYDSSDLVDSPRGTRDSTPDFDAGDEKTFEFTSAPTKNGTDSQEGPSAADYDPTNDMKLDDERRHQHDHVGQVSAADYDETKPTDQDILIPEKTPPIPPQPTPPPTSTAAADDEDDMFATPPSPKSKPKAKEEIANKPAPVIEARHLDASMLDTWHDAEGYYVVILGELLNKRYVVQANLGKGMFSGVVRCIDNEANGKEVAIKILRNNEAMRKAGLKEIRILEKLQEADPDGRKHVIRLEGWFEHRGHLCLVFENLSLNLREVLKRFGRDVGINLRAVRAYAQQMFVGLSLLRKCNLLHADLKPDNILISENRTTLKICDLGSASDISENEITPYLVSRFYRAPEIILGIPYDYAIDIWSIGCTLYELYTGKILFPGRSNNQMLRFMMECRGRFPSKMLRKAHFLSSYFNEQMVFMVQEVDSVTGNEVVRPLNIQKPTKELKVRVGTAATAGEAGLLASFVDLLGRCLELNPEKRITPAEAFRHPFIKL